MRQYDCDAVTGKSVGKYLGSVAYIKDSYFKAIMMSLFIRKYSLRSHQYFKIIETRNIIIKPYNFFLMKR
jgi:hypothetical protein